METVRFHLKSFEWKLIEAPEHVVVKHQMNQFMFPNCDKQAIEIPSHLVKNCQMFWKTG